jgi:hypothetical protein
MKKIWNCSKFKISAENNIESLCLKEKVAIVGNSGRLLKSDYGSFIDTFDEVIRFNRAITEGYTNYVGNKTTLRVVNNNVFDNTEVESYGYTNSPQYFVKNLKNKRLLYIGPDFGPLTRRDKNMDPSNELFYFNYNSSDQIKKYFLGKKIDRNFTVGGLAILLTVISGIKPEIFGFDLTDEEVFKKPCTHYWEERETEVDQISHNYREEKELLRRLVAENKIIYHK